MHASKKFIVTSIIAFLLPQLSYAGCSGNACKEVLLTNINGCMYVVNNGTRPVKITTGVGGHSPTVYGQSQVKILSWDGIMRGTGECMRNLGRNWTANYDD